MYVGYRMTELFAGDVDAQGRRRAARPTVSGIDDDRRRPGDRDDGHGRHARRSRATAAPRDNYIHTHGIESDTFPTATFKLTAADRAAAPGSPKGSR